MPMIILLTASLLTGIAIYMLIPCLSCRIDLKLNRIRLRDPPNHRMCMWGILPWFDKAASRLVYAGFQDRRAPLVYLSCLVLPAPLLGVAGHLADGRGGQAFLLGLVISTVVNTVINRRIQSRKRAFNRALYKIYRFLGQQLSSGIRMTDALKGLPEVIADSAVRPSLVRFAARYELTLDIDQSFAEIRKDFKNKEAALLSSHIKQCLQTGQAGRTITRMEDLLFSRYFSLMQADTKKIRLQLVMSAMLSILPVLALFLYPLFKQALDAMQTVFG